MTTPAWIEAFNKKFPDGSSHFCGCYEGDLSDRWLIGKEELLAFIAKTLSSELQAVLGEELNKNEVETVGEGPIIENTFKYIDGWNAHREACLKKAKERGIILPPKEREY